MERVGSMNGPWCEDEVALWHACCCIRAYSIFSWGTYLESSTNSQLRKIPQILTVRVDAVRL